MINSGGNGPYAVRTALGWTVNGPFSQAQATVNRVSVENVEQLWLQQYNQGFPECLCDEKLEMSQEDQQSMTCVIQHIMLMVIMSLHSQRGRL